MGIGALLITSVGLAMDASAVGMTNGMTNSKMKVNKVLLIGLFFGFFQFLMPLIGYYLTGLIAGVFLDTFEKISGWLSFAILAFLGGRMIWESVQEMRARKLASGNENVQESTQDNVQNNAKADVLPLQKLFMQAIATSIDALAMGVAFYGYAISEAGLALGAWGATGMVGIVTFALTVVAVYIGKAVGDKLADKAGLFGGLVLVGIGLKLLLEGLL